MTERVIVSDRLHQLVESINKITKKEVLVGIPQANAERKEDEGGPMSNAALGYIHENGSPAANIPARPFLIPGIQMVSRKVEAQLKIAMQALIDRKTEKAEAAIEKAGMIAANGAKAKINSGDFEPLADSTLRARAARGRKGAAAELKSRREGNAPSTEGAKPLIDTGQLRNSITYVVRGK